VLQGSISGYSYWLKHPVGLRAEKEQQRLASVKKVSQQSDCRYGRPRIAVEWQQPGIPTSRPRIARLMRKQGMQSIIRQKYRIQTTDFNQGYALTENYLNREFATSRLAEKWVSDLTYIKTPRGLALSNGRGGPS